MLITLQSYGFFLFSKYSFKSLPFCLKSSHRKENLATLTHFTPRLVKSSTQTWFLDRSVKLRLEMKGLNVDCLLCFIFNFLIFFFWESCEVFFWSFWNFETFFAEHFSFSIAKKPLTVFARKAPSQMFNWILKHTYGYWYFFCKPDILKHFTKSKKVPVSGSV